MDVAALGRARGHDLLRQNIERRLGNDQPIQIALPDRTNQRRALEQIVARGREEASLGNRAAPVTGATDALQRHRNRPRRTDLAHQIDRANIDAKLQRSRRHQHFDFAFFQLSLRIEAQLARQTAMMRGDIVFAQPLAQMMRNALRQCAAC